jgi:riboflavin biosynthesis pyrimidine reductase
VLTASAIDFSHPVFASSARPIVFTTRDAARSLSPPANVEVVGNDAPSARAAIDHLRNQRGCRSVAIEAGPRTAVPLYEPLAIDELMLSVFEGALDPRAIGGAFPSNDELVAAGLALAGETIVNEPSGPWRFSRWIRPDRRDSAASSR